ncbi:MAG: N-acetylmuramoyl-L-alanine amidase, partial [Myxococcales bacterium]|nr:N-acetylmuramoyl-L-alanine amidase [Myxococcales bacterium]
MGTVERHGGDALVALHQKDVVQGFGHGGLRVQASCSHRDSGVSNGLGRSVGTTLPPFSQPLSIFPTLRIPAKPSRPASIQHARPTATLVGRVSDPPRGLTRWSCTTVGDGGPPAVNRARFSNAATAALLVATAWLAAPPLAARESVPRFDTVILDAGHGGEDPGARGGRKLEEKDLVLTLTEQLAARLRGAGFHVVLTRASDVFVSLEERFSIANDARGDLFVSIHANASEDPEAHGSEVYFYGDEASDASARSVAARENLAFRDSGLGGGMTADPVLAILGDLKRGAYQVESARFAGHAEKQLARVGSRRSRGV